MDLTALIESLKEDEPPAGLTPALQALWYEAKGDWEGAHRTAQSHDDPDSAWVHAYLHRVDGDDSNAAYWYRRVEKPVCSAPLKEEWRQIASALLGG